jgi:hypothetical protein
MSVLKQKHEIERQINALFTDVRSMSNDDAFQKGASVQDLLDMKNRLTAVLKNAMKIRINVKTFNNTQSNKMYQINTDEKSTIHALFRNIKFKFIVIRDIFLQQLESQPQTLTQPQVNEMQDFLSSTINTILLRDAHLLPQVGSPVQRVRSPNARSPSAAQSPNAARRYSNHRSSVITSPSAAANAFIRRRISHPPAHAPQVVSHENVIVNHHSPNEQLGCFGRMCDSIKFRFSMNRVHPGSNVGGKRKLRRRTRRTRRGRGRRTHLN